MGGIGIEPVFVSPTGVGVCFFETLNRVYRIRE
jgi:hypothetical protein